MPVLGQAYNITEILNGFVMITNINLGSYHIIYLDT
eukprot:SAG31_NODE_7446_length_1687_cov_1.370277_1_plen_35_part_10